MWTATRYTFAYSHSRLKSVVGLAMQYEGDENNPTGLLQVVEELAIALFKAIAPVLLLLNCPAS